MYTTYTYLVLCQVKPFVAVQKVTNQNYNAVVLRKIPAADKRLCATDFNLASKMRLDNREKKSVENALDIQQRGKALQILCVATDRFDNPSQKIILFLHSHYRSIPVNSGYSPTKNPNF